MPHMFYINSHGSEHTSHRQYSTNAVFVVVNILLHGECFIDIKIYEFTALMTDNSVCLSFAVLSLYLLMKGKGNASLVSYGISLFLSRYAFFLLPVYAIAFMQKKK